MDMDDQATYRRFLSGSIEAFEQLVLDHKDHLILFLLKYTAGDLYLAEDAAQEAFATIYVHKERYHFDCSFKTYLYSIARHKALDEVRKFGRLNEYSIEEASEAAGDSLFGCDTDLEERICRAEDQRQMHKAIGRLKTEYQQAILLINLEELSYAEAARVMGKSLAQMRVLVHRARAALANVLEQEMIL
jgi:RNA polymerase sigma factor (sigma-70 family)